MPPNGCRNDQDGTSLGGRSPPVRQCVSVSVSVSGLVCPLPRCESFLLLLLLPSRPLPDSSSITDRRRDLRSSDTRAVISRSRGADSGLFTKQRQRLFNKKERQIPDLVLTA
ncbi:hypothetical protein MRV_0120 [Murid herpesvirus 3]|uniref:Uncharacterized protein n=2 Tax=Murid betaherpesvirus 3 TaxID=2560603 RepID=A0A1P8VJ13_9BETA|nr:hypothetical protein MRV_0120 [Murine roseolovirus]APZ76331.1 hypothetical protein MRV_0120 [Murid betaherpesvirus 3]AYH64810.1 hypothetical protein MRV_0120 [Murid herpesvirus 3]